MIYFITMNSSSRPQCATHSLSSAPTDFTTLESIICYVLDENGIISFMSAGIRKLLDVDPAEVCGQHFSVLFPEPIYKQVSRAHVLPKYKNKTTGSENAPKLFDERRRQNRMTHNLELTLKNPLTGASDEIVRVFLISAEGIYDPGKIDTRKGVATGFCGSRGIIVDISSYKRQQQARAKLEKHIVQAQNNEKLATMLHNMGNDITNKMGVIVGYTDIIQKKYFADGDTSARRCCGEILNASKTTSHLARQLMKKMQANEEKPVRVDLESIIDEVIELIKNTLDKNIVVNKFLHSDLHMVYADRVQIYKALITLAMKACSNIEQAATLVFADDDISLDADFIKKHELLSNEQQCLRCSIILHTDKLRVETGSRIVTPCNSNTFSEAEKKLGIHHAYTYLHNQHAFLEVITTPHSGIKYDIYFPQKSEKCATY